MSLKFVLFSALILASTAHAEEVNLGINGKATVQMREVDGEYVLGIRLPSGNTQKIQEEFVPFEFEGSPAAIAIVDFDGDGSEEFVVRAMIPPQSGALYIYRYSAKEKKFVPMVVGKANDDTFLPVDAVAPVRMDREGRVTARIAVRSEMGEKSQDREYRLVQGKFKRIR